MPAHGDTIDENKEHNNEDEKFPMISFIRKLFESPESEAMRKLSDSNKRIDKAGGAWGFIRIMAENDIFNNDQRRSILSCGVVTVDDTTAVDVRLAALRILYDFRAHALKNATTTNLSLRSTDTDLLAIPEVSFAQSMFVNAHLLLDHAVLSDINANIDFQALDLGNAQEAADNARIQIAQHLLLKILDDVDVSSSVDVDPKSIIESIDDAAITFFCGRAVSRTREAMEAFEKWRDADIATLKQITGLR